MTPYLVAKKFEGKSEVSGTMDNPIIMEWLRLDNTWPDHDEVPWCSAFVNWICWLTDTPRSKSLLARSWLGIGESIPVDNARQGYDIAILKRGGSNQPGPDNLIAPGHVGFYAFNHGADIWLLGGNQGNSVSIAKFSIDDLLGIRRLL